MLKWQEIKSRELKNFLGEILLTQRKPPARQRTYSLYGVCMTEEICVLQDETVLKSKIKYMLISAIPPNRTQ